MSLLMAEVGGDPWKKRRKLPGVVLPLFRFAVFL